MRKGKIKSSIVGTPLGPRTISIPESPLLNPNANEVRVASVPRFPIPPLPSLVPPVRVFDTGATRDQDATKPDYEGYLSPLVIARFGEYMTLHRKQSDGSLRDSDNWQKGIPLSAYMKSGWRHFLDWWNEHRGLVGREGLEDAICGLLFNANGYLHETLKARGYLAKDRKGE